MKEEKENKENSMKEFLQKMKDAGEIIDTVEIKDEDGKSKKYLIIEGHYLVPTAGAHEGKMGIMLEIVNESMGTVFRIILTNKEYLVNLKNMIEDILNQVESLSKMYR